MVGALVLLPPPVPRPATGPWGVLPGPVPRTRLLPDLVTDGFSPGRPRAYMNHAALPEAVALRSQTGWTGSGSHRYSYGGFGGGHPHLHPHTDGPATPIFDTRQMSAGLAHSRVLAPPGRRGSGGVPRALFRLHATDVAPADLQDAEVQSRRRDASCRRPFTHCEGRVPKAEGPGQDRDQVLSPAMERSQTASSRRNMGGCCVVEDTDQNVDQEEQPSCAEKGVQKFHLSSPPAWTLQLVRMSDRFAGSRRGTCGRRMSCSSPRLNTIPI